MRRPALRSESNRSRNSNVETYKHQVRFRDFVARPSGLSSCPSVASVDAKFQRDFNWSVLPFNRFFL